MNIKIAAIILDDSITQDFLFCLGGGWYFKLFYNKNEILKTENIFKMLRHIVAIYYLTENRESFAAV